MCNPSLVSKQASTNALHQLSPNACVERSSERRTSHSDGSLANGRSRAAGRRLVPGGRHVASGRRRGVGHRRSTGGQTGDGRQQPRAVHGGWIVLRRPIDQGHVATSLRPCHVRRRAGVGGQARLPHLGESHRTWSVVSLTTCARSEICCIHLLNRIYPRGVGGG